MNSLNSKLRAKLAFQVRHLWRLRCYWFTVVGGCVRSLKKPDTHANTAIEYPREVCTRTYALALRRQIFEDESAKQCRTCISIALPQSVFICLYLWYRQLSGILKVYRFYLWHVCKMTCFKHVCSFDGYASITLFVRYFDATLTTWSVIWMINITSRLEKRPWSMIIWGTVWRTFM